MGSSVAGPTYSGALPSGAFSSSPSPAGREIPGFMKPGVFQQRPTFNMPGAPIMPMNIWAQQAWIRNTPNAFGKKGPKFPPR